MRHRKIYLPFTHWTIFRKMFLGISLGGKYSPLPDRVKGFNPILAEVFLELETAEGGGLLKPLCKIQSSGQKMTFDTFKFMFRQNVETFILVANWFERFLTHFLVGYQKFLQNTPKMPHFPKNNKSPKYGSGRYCRHQHVFVISFPYIN